MKDANFAPVYCALYPGLAEVTRQYGYALAIHGTLGRDMDLICIPWAETVGSHEDVIAAITKKFAIRQINGSEKKNHNRMAYTLSIAFGECAIDLSFMPTESGHHI